MKKLLYILLSAILAAATACHHRSAASLGDFDISLYAPAYSSGFEIFGAEGMKSTILKTYAPWQGAEGEETQLFIARNGEQAPADFPGQVLDGDARRIVCMSSTYIAMLDALGEPQRVVGVSGIDYISNPYVASHKEQIGDVGYDGNMNYERLLSLSPDIVLHVTRFFPRWKMSDARPTPVETVHRLADVAREELSHVYVGNC